MTSRNNCEVSAQPGPRKPSSDSDRARKRDRSVLTTTVGGSVCRDRSKNIDRDFKKPRLQPVGGSGRRDQSKSLTRNFKKPRLPKRRLRAKKVPSKGAAPPAANVTTPTSSLAPPTPSMAPPTPSSTPPTPSLAPPTYPMTPPTPLLTPPTPSSAPPTPLTPPTPPLAPLTPSLALPTPSLAPPSITEVRSDDMWTKGIYCHLSLGYHSRPVPLSHDWGLRSRILDSFWRGEAAVSVLSYRHERSREQGSEEHLWKQYSTFVVDVAEFVNVRSFFVDEGKVKQRIVQLLRRDERSRQQDSEEHLQKQQDLSSLFRDMEESGELWRMDEWFWRLQRPTSLCEDVDKAVEHFLLLGDEARLRKERQRLYRFQKLLEQWSEAFTRGKHGVSFRVGECLKDVLAEVHKEISFLSWVETVQRSESGDERSRQQDSEEHLQKQQDLNSLFRDMEESGELRRSFPERLERLQKACRLRRYFTLWKLHGRSSENFILMGGSADQKTEDPTGVSSLYRTGRFCRSSSGKTRRSLSVRNTRKYLRRVHTRTAGGALRRGPQPDCKLESRLSGSQ